MSHSTAWFVRGGQTNSQLTLHPSEGRAVTRSAHVGARLAFFPIGGGGEGQPQQGEPSSGKDMTHNQVLAQLKTSRAGCKFDLSLWLPSVEGVVKRGTRSQSQIARPMTPSTKGNPKLRHKFAPGSRASVVRAFGCWTAGS